MHAINVGRLGGRRAVTSSGSSLVTRLGRRRPAAPEYARVCYDAAAGAAAVAPAHRVVTSAVPVRAVTGGGSLDPAVATVAGSCAGRFQVAELHQSGGGTVVGVSRHPGEAAMTLSTDSGQSFGSMRTLPGVPTPSCQTSLLNADGGGEIDRLITSAPSNPATRQNFTLSAGTATGAWLAVLQGTLFPSTREARLARFSRPRLHFRGLQGWCLAAPRHRGGSSWHWPLPRNRTTVLGANVFIVSRHENRFLADAPVMKSGEQPENDVLTKV